MSNSYLDVVEAVKNYYGSGSDEWVEIAKYGIRPDNIDVVKQVPGVEIITNSDGSYRGWNYNNPFSTDASTIADEINSNVQSGAFNSANTFNATVPVNTSVNPSTGNYDMVSGSKNVSSGTSVSTIARAVSTGIAAVTAGCRLGKFFAQETYNQNPNYWDEQLPTMNPETWSSIAGDNELGQKVMQFLFGIDPETNETTAYMDEDAFAYMAYAMLQMGMFGTGGGDVVGKTPVVGTVSISECVKMTGVQFITKYIGLNAKNDINGKKASEIINESWVQQEGYLLISGDELAWIASPSITSFPVTSVTNEIGQVPATDTTCSAYVYSYNNGSSFPTLFSARNGSTVWEVEQAINGNLIGQASGYYGFFLGSMQEGLPDGVSNQPDYTAPDTSTWTNPETTKQSLQQQYPDFWNGAVYNEVPQPNGTIKRYTYIPVPTTPTTSKTEKQPTNTTVTKNQIKVNPNTSPSDQTNTITRYVIDGSSPSSSDTPTLPNTPVANPPDTGEGNTPTIVTPTGDASALWSVYNPTQAQLDSFGSWLWSSDFFSQLKKLFNDPMQAIIGVHKVFATPQVSGQATIKCGYIDSEVPSNVVGSQYAIVNCGTVSLREYFGNVFDYAPYTEVKLFLPFIGVVPLDTSYVMRGSISVTYHVDVITGACLAEVSVRRDSAGGIIYTFGGSCIVQYPVSSGSYMSVISGVLGTVASGVMAGVSIGTGNPIGAVYGISGAAQSILNTHTNVQHSGGFTGCTGAMGGKKPYLIISRPQTELNGHEPHMSGLPSNDYITLSSRSGFIRCKHVHVTGIDNATASEKDEIERLLKQGVMI